MVEGYLRRSKIGAGERVGGIEIDQPCRCFEREVYNYS